MDEQSNVWVFSARFAPFDVGLQSITQEFDEVLTHTTDWVHTKAKVECGLHRRLGTGRLIP